MVSRVYVEKKPGFDGEAKSLERELRDIVGIERLTGVRLVNRYDVEGASEELFASCVPTVFSEPQSDDAALRPARCARRGRCSPWSTCPASSTSAPTRPASASSSSARASAPMCAPQGVRTWRADLTDADVDAIKHYVINPVEAREASLEPRDTLAMDSAAPSRRGGHRGLPRPPTTSWPASSPSAAWPWIWPTSSSASATSLTRSRDPHHHGDQE